MNPAEPNGPSNEFAWCKAAFLAVIEAPEPDRARVLSDWCAADPLRREALQVLIREHRRAGTPLDGPAALLAPANHADLGASDDEGPLRAGERLGRYEILGRLGTGAMGIVYEARQEGTERLVALKVVRPERMSARARRHFEAEGRALARLRHPGIAQVYETGVARVGEDRVPFMAMELVRGRPITEAAAGLPLAQKLELLAQVCEAVQHAHLSGVVHRDLKPGNVLVEPPDSERGGGAEGWRPKVLDFGIAKLTEGDEGAMTTVDGQIVGTPAYMSPEQLVGDAQRVDHRSDVYALGVVLYELLAGRRPAEPEGTSLLAAVRSLGEQTPPRLGSLDRSLRGDLDTIACKALERDPERRYRSAGELAADLRRHLSRQPILARRPTRLYVARRFVRRNPWQVGLAAAALLAVLVGSAGTAVKAREAGIAEARARQRFDQLRDVVRSMLFDTYDALADIPGTTEVRREIVATAQQYLDALAADPFADDGLRLEIAEGYIRLGDVQGYTNRANLGDRAGAGRSHSRALAILEALALRRPEDDAVARALARVLMRIPGTTMRGAGREECAPIYERAAKIAEALVRRHPRDAGLAAEHVEMLMRSGLVGGNSDPPPPDQRGRILASAVAAADAAVARRLRSPELEQATADALYYYGCHVLEHPQEGVDGLAAIARSRDLARELLLAESGSYRAAARLGNAELSTAREYGRRYDRERAEFHLREALSVFERLTDSDPTDQQAYRAVEICHLWAGEIYEALSAAPAADPGVVLADLRAAEASFQRARELLGKRSARGWLPEWESHYVGEYDACLARVRSKIAQLGGPG